MTQEYKLTYSEVLESISKQEFTIFNDVVCKPDQEFSLASLKNKVEQGLYFLSSSFESELNNISNSLILVDFEPKDYNSNTYIKVENPQLTHYSISNKFEQKPTPSIHETAIINPKAKIHKSAHIGPYCIIGDCEIQENVQLLSSITINNNVIIKKNTIIEANSLIGARGMAWIWNAEGKRVMQPQLGGVIIGEDCIIGSDISIVRGSLSENTYIGNGTIIAHGTKIGHGSYIEDQVHMANNVSLAGNTRIGKQVFLGSACIISSNVSVAEGCIVGAGSVLNRSIEEKHATIVGVPGKIIKKNNFKHKPNGAPKPFKKKPNE